MASCRACGVEITWAVTGAGDRLPVESAPSYKGPDRYRIDAFLTGETETPWQVSAVNAEAVVEAHVDHRTTCPVRTGG